MDHIGQALLKPEISVLIIGGGGIGSYFVSMLAQLNHKLCLLSEGRRCINALVADGDTFSHTNIGSQNCYPCDIGRHKASTLVARLNAGFGTRWQALDEYIDLQCESTLETIINTDIVVTCVDKARFRYELGELAYEHTLDTDTLWLDGGCSATSGQVILGHLGYPPAAQRLPNVWDLYHRQLSVIEDVQTDSCSHAESLARQDFGVPQITASWMAQALWQVIRHNRLEYQGSYFDVTDGTVCPLKPDPVVWRSLGYQAH